MSTNTNSLSFFQERLAPLGVTEDNNRFSVVNPEAEFPMPKRHDSQIFSEDANGNIEILYWTLDRELITWTRIGDGKMSAVNGKPQHYSVKRLKEPGEKGKYQFPESKWLKAEGKPAHYPWIAPELVDSWERREQIPVLFLTEGVFKAWLGCKYGMPTVALGSVTLYAEDGKLYRDIQRMIIDCKVQEVVVMWDGDCLDISETALARREDIAKRPAGFYSSAKKIRKLIGEIDMPEGQEAPAVYFYHIQSDIYNEKPKGLDDLLVAAKAKGDIDTIVKQALQTSHASPYFKKIDITDTTALLREHFCLHDKEKFYRRHAGIIKSSEFKFFGDLLRWNEEEEAVELIAPKWADELKWVGNEYFQEVLVPSVNNTTRRELSPRNMATLSKLYGANFWKYLSHFAGFCNVPSHTNYQMVIESAGKKYLNQYFPFRWTPEPGDWHHTKEFLQHIFGTDKVKHELTGDEIERWELGLDYVQQLYLNPTQQLPVLILFSPENQSGKSTFNLLLQLIFEDNVVPIGNADLQSDFNSTYSSKLLATCEETLLERKKEAERIKAISTSPRILVNPKGQAQYQIDFFCKFIFTSNNPRMIYVNRHDTRFWIIKVPQLKKKIPNFDQVLKAEIPAFLHHLQTRQPAAKLEGRMYFHDSLLKTDALEETVRINEPTAATDMRERIAEMFLHEKDLERLEMPLSDIRDRFFSSRTSDGWIREILRDYLQVDQLRNPLTGELMMKRGSYPVWDYDKDKNDLVRKEIPFRNRPYVFYRKDFVTDENPDDWKEIEKTEQQLARERAGIVEPKVESKPITAEVPDDLPF